MAEKVKGTKTGAERQQLDCAKGTHGTLIYGLVTERAADCVNRDIVCLQCGSVIGHESWTREAWDRRGKFRHALGPDR